MSHRLPSLNRLRAFEAAARHESFAGAARELGLTASAVSQQVKALEIELRVPLFERGRKSLHLTEAGADYAAPLTQAFRIVTDATEAVSPVLPGRKLRIGADETVLGLFSRNWPRDQPSLHPHVVLTARSGDPDQISEDRVDAVIGMSSVSEPGLAVEVIAPATGPASGGPVYLACAEGLADCHQARALRLWLGTEWDPARSRRTGDQ